MKPPTSYSLSNELENQKSIEFDDFVLRTCARISLFIHVIVSAVFTGVFDREEVDDDDDGSSSKKGLLRVH